ncbi:magnesium-translocating P-type ATPase [Janthinobacterium agaricidamnosum]|uniref:Magnesium-transporting ATPase, P-type 1 n=1 Tax=Janthinobacterium agaricidamnosum NBRC 102515 = DSM 9628 TaxID=1349767 RepID=W0V2M5_9BURK|nr:magnesium-translocating P-type ATPase [Janthinobacterium agaricidamnosum]CDG81507.1 magnesium-translocating P-type ATPase [Janthinobacterium agaricidamnosum NBRC 102515 = DSM 9628]
MKLFKNLSGRLLSWRELGRNFHLRPIGDAATPGKLARAVPQRMANDLMRASREDLAAVLVRLRTSEHGLSGAQVKAVRLRSGSNQIAHEKPLPWWRHLWLCYRNPFNLLLTALVLLSFFNDDTKATWVIASMVLLSTLIRFVVEGRSHRAALRLQVMVGNTASVIRRDLSDDAAADARRYFNLRMPARASRQIEVPFSQLVPGEIIVLSAGDMIPADCRVLEAKDLFVSQAAMTGEFLPVEKFAERQRFAGDNPLDLDNLLYMGTNVVSGSAMAVVLAVGGATYFGAIAARLGAAGRAPTAFQAGVNSVSWLLIRFALVMTPFVLLVNGAARGDWGQACLFALSVAVGLTPEMLPMIVTSALARGATLLARKRVIVKRLDAMQNFGAMDVLCTDKTGTLTQDRMILARHTDAFGGDNPEVFRLAFLNSHFQTGLKNLLDTALLMHMPAETALHIRQQYAKVDEVPFDFQRRRMSVIVDDGNGERQLVCKGAVEEILSVCSRVRQGGGTVALDKGMLERLLRVTRDLNEEGLRVVAVAVRTAAPDQTVFSVDDESGLTLAGYLTFVDPPKDSAAPALAALAAHGVTVKVLTGDNELVTAKICRELGLVIDGMVLGPQIERMKDDQLARVAQKNTVFARLTPLHKERLVTALRGNGHIVGFMGDGINDAAALRAADIGISVDSAVDIAREAADIILLEKDLMVLEAGVIEGRKTFSNMLKYIRITASSNFGNVFSVLVASAFLPFLPMLPLHLLVQNLLYDIAQIALPFDQVDRELLAKPLQWNPRGIGRFMLFFGPLSSLFDMATFALMWLVFGANTVASQGLFQSGWFVVGLLTQTLVVHLIRTPKLPFIHSIAAWPVLAMTGIVMAVGIYLPMGPMAGYFKLEALPLLYFPWLAGILLCYAIVTTGLKRFYIRKFGWQ